MRRRVPTALTFWQVDNPDVGERLDAFHPNVVMVFGYAHRTSWRVRTWSMRRHCPLLLYSDSSALNRPSFPLSAVKGAAVSAFYRGVDGAFTVGDTNRAYHLQWGLPPGRVFPGILPVDRSRLLQAVGSGRAESREAFRASLGIETDEFVVLLSGKLVERKRPVDLLYACERLRLDGLRIRPVIVGDGPLRSRIEQAVTRMSCRPVLTGFLNQSEIPHPYLAADALAVTSDFDPHPLVVTEGAVFGLPVVISDRVGCIGPGDTARPQVNALVYPCGDVHALSEALRLLVKNPQLRTTMSEASRRVGATQDSSTAARLLVTAVRQLIVMGKR
jgi:glycosyltransferase involved in cell wall biosynthesis